MITLNKGDKGLGFSILDYQDPLNMSETVIVVRSLVPGGNVLAILEFQGSFWKILFIKIPKFCPNIIYILIFKQKYI